jgi:hypothetical protein
MPTYNIFGWQRPCYLLTDEGYAPSFQSLMQDTEWDKYGVGKNPACDNCMAHCGFEGTAVDDAFAHPFKALMSALRGPTLTGPMAADPPILYGDRRRPERARRTVATVPVEAVKRANRLDDGHAEGAADGPAIGDTDGGHTARPR